ncbi:MAG: peptidoglycan editing factor PgeF [Deltaproteobacteria bacterium]|nr:peptidoglycan editing factor PgeF [Deltaproteobacteria bacterium]
MVSAQCSSAGSEGSLPAFPLLHAWNLPRLVHGFITREGGVSQGLYRSFNLAEGVGDDPNAVNANWARWRAAYPQMRLARLQQVHGSRVHPIGSAYNGERRIGDGMVTSVPGIVLAIFTADCVPVLMIDAEAGIAGALHAGWRGTLAGIASEGVSAMAAMGARLGHIRVALGPSIGSCCFEVDTDLAERFIAHIPTAVACCRLGRPGKKHLDLRGIVRLQLQEVGVAASSIVDIGPCTRCESARFFSRRAAGGVATGLQMSFIGFEPEH